MPIRRLLAATLIGCAVIAGAAAASASAAPRYDMSGTWSSYASGAPNGDSLDLQMDSAGNISGSATVSGQAFTLGGSEDASAAATLKLSETAAQFPPSGYTSTDVGTVTQNGNCFSGSWSDTVGGPGHSGTFIWVRNGASVDGAGTTASAYVCAASAGGPLPAPVIAKAVNVMPVSGHVFVKLPGSAASAAFAPPAWAMRTMGPLVKGQGFIALTQARQIPVGSQVDARRGSLALVSASSVRHQTYTGTFSSGLFQILQGRAQKGLTTLHLLEGGFAGAPSYKACASAGKAAAGKQLSSKVLQTLAATVKGNFATRGRYSSAAVRGTQWTTSDRCDGTLVKVRRGVVAVRDFVRRKTVVLTAGHSYLAKAP